MILGGNIGGQELEAAFDQANLAYGRRVAFPLGDTQKYALMQPHTQKNVCPLRDAKNLSTKS